jgi:hypothetical protein
MYLIAIAWLYVALMMALAEAVSPQGSVLGALFTFVLYGVAPMGLVLYLVGTPARRKARRLAEARSGVDQALSDPGGPASGQRDGSHHAPAEPLPPVREEA